MSYQANAFEEQLRLKLRGELNAARAQTDRLFQMLAPSAMYERPIPERHRILFYLGHLEAFDWNMIGHTSFGAPSLHPEFDRMFAFGIDPVDGQLPQDQASDWPGIDEIQSYSHQVRSAVDDFLARANFVDAHERFLENGQIFHVAIEHRLMHAETLAYLLHWLPYDMKHGTPSGIEKDPAAPKPYMIEIPAGAAVLGQTLEDPLAFGWDNEFHAHSVSVPTFSIDAFNVTNGQFLDFVHADCYHDHSLWTPESWRWIRTSETAHPKFWIRRDSGWFYRTMFGEVPLPLSWPVYVSHAEAEAYARHAGKSLPSEAQYHRAAKGNVTGNYNFHSWTPLPVGAPSSGQSTFGVFDLVGNGWEWTSTVFAPFDGFQPFPFYPGYSADFFDGKHFVMKGASPQTAAALVRPSFRNWFQPYYPNIYATFRCVEN